MSMIIRCSRYQPTVLAVIKRVLIIVSLKTPKTKAMLRLKLFLVCSLFFVPTTQASLVFQMDMEALAQQAPFVFEGKVRSKQVRPSKITGQPCTYFLFDVLDVIKGEFAQPKIELCFAGGTLNGVTMTVSDMNMPTVGEKGIYFVATLSGEPVHPLLGWSQGHYVIKKDSTQTERVVPAFHAHTDQNRSERIQQSIQAPPDIDTFKKLIRDQL